MCGHQATTLNDRDTTRMQICLSPYPKQTQTDHNNFNHSVSQLVSRGTNRSANHFGDDLPNQSLDWLTGAKISLPNQTLG